MANHPWQFSSPDFHRFAGYLNSHGHKMPAGREKGNNLGTAADAALWLTYQVTAGRPFEDVDKQHLHYLRLDDEHRAGWAADYIDAVVGAEGLTDVKSGRQVVAAVQQAMAEQARSTGDTERANGLTPRFAPPPTVDLPLPGEAEGSIAKADEQAHEQAARRQRRSVERTDEQGRPAPTPQAREQR